MKPKLSVARILDPRSVAVIGASDDKAKFGGRVMHYLVKHGFPGAIHPVNPRRDRVMGLPAHPSIGEVPEPVDVAMLAVPAASLLKAIEECAVAGVGACIVMTTGFAEADQDGAQAQARMVDIARAHGMRIIGPNCMGMINPSARCALTSSLVLEVDELPTGRIGLISQSGALMVSMFNKAQDAGIGFSSCISLGNQCDLEICDFLEHMIDDAATEAICLYVEGFVAPRRFLQLAARCRGRNKPLLVVKTGRTPEGVRAAKSHTASLAGSYEVLQAACRDLGVILVDDPDGMIRIADALVRWPGVSGGGVAILSPSGGGAGVAVDRIIESNLGLARLGERTTAGLLDILLPPQADNPVDLGGRRDQDSVAAAGQAATLLARDVDVGSLLVVLTTVPDYESTTMALAEAANSAGKPVLFVVTPGSAADGPRKVLSERSCVWFDDLDQAIRVLRGLEDWANVPSADTVSRQPQPVDCAGKLLLPADGGQLTEPEVKSLLKAYGIPVTREILTGSEDAAVEAAAQIGYPVALKVVSRDIVHKSDAGGVVLAIADELRLREAWRHMNESFSEHSGTIDGLLVQEMALGDAELIVGARMDEQFGPTILVGFGGIFVEVLKDVQLALAPIPIERARQMLHRLSMWPLLAGTRNRLPLDVEAAADIMWRLGCLATDLGNRLVDIEINPLLLRRAGDGATAVDARAAICSAAERGSSY